VIHYRNLQAQTGNLCLQVTVIIELRLDNGANL